MASAGEALRVDVAPHCAILRMRIGCLGHRRKKAGKPAPFKRFPICQLAANSIFDLDGRSNQLRLLDSKRATSPMSANSATFR